MVDERPLQFGGAGLPCSGGGLVVFKPVPCSASKREVELVDALLGRPLVVMGYTFIVLQPILDVLVDLTVIRYRANKGRWPSGNRPFAKIPKARVRHATNNGSTRYAPSYRFFLPLPRGMRKQAQVTIAITFEHPTAEKPSLIVGRATSARGRESAPFFIPLLCLTASVVCCANALPNLVKPCHSHGAK